MTALAVDTSVAVPLLLRSHRAHAAAIGWAGDQELALAGHAVAETYSVLTRLPGDARLLPADAARLIDVRFGRPLLLRAATTARLPRLLAARGIAGGATYDAMVALAAVEHDTPLGTRDARARSTYEAMGAQVVVVS